MTYNQKPILRCAIYTRKSSEEGLDQSFNSLDAQREACEAFILSQREEGWKALPSLYDDGGFSDGNMERPALQRLLEDVEAKKRGHALPPSILAVEAASVVKTNVRRDNFVRESE